MSSEELPPSNEFVVTDRRRTERRQQTVPVAIERRKSGERRDDGGIERRRQVDPTTCEREYTEDEIAFMLAMDQYKRDNRRPFPTWSEVLEVLHALGYRKVADASLMPGNSPTMPPMPPPKG